ncbi:hypothetical protein P0136_04490 [Lentisphaerota bacterium ZTH]|nr:hypothetical protein JYG24_04395 [Lentisphaerota bacterium]WET07253.1 hypothetical protein P0136_04490 [Lentisphaerota bacterium ZTH]
MGYTRDLELAGRFKERRSATADGSAICTVITYGQATIIEAVYEQKNFKLNLKHSRILYSLINLTVKAGNWCMEKLFA